MDAGFQALFEVVAWSGAIRDRLAQDGAALSPELRGLWFVRNLVIHQGADALAGAVVQTAALDIAVPDLTFVLDSPTISEWQWRFRSELPPPQSKRGDREYETHLEGRSVRVTLEALGTFLRPLSA